MKVVWENGKFAAWLTIPALLFYLLPLFNHAPEMVATGFTQEDNVSYVAFAKQYLDEPSTSLLYSNPLSDGPHEKIYFQPQLFLIVLLLKTGMPPGYSLLAFCIIFTYLSFLMLIYIYDLLISEKAFRKISIILLSWGGGMLSLGGFFLIFFKRALTGLNFILPENLWSWQFAIDPASGWWGLNFGRSLLFSMEAFYHAFFLLAIYLVLKKKWGLAVLSAFCLSLAHPFTGLELLLIITIWIWGEKLFFDKTTPFIVLAAFTLLVGFHIWYYLVYLMQFPEHAIVFKQYSLNWRLRYFNILPAYCIAGLLAIFSFKICKFGQRWQKSTFRLTCVWLIIVFLLINHEWFLTPRQPIHFTRGYFYTSLFLVGIPALHFLLNYLNQKRKWLLYLFILLALSDNILWLTSTRISHNKSSSVKLISKEEQELLNWINYNSSPNSLIISSNDLLPYLSTVYTKAYALTPHPYTTPFIDRKVKEFKEFSSTGVPPQSWVKRDVIWIINRKNSNELIQSKKNNYTTQYESENYLVVRPIRKSD